jgi:ferrous iron transport protein A
MPYLCRRVALVTLHQAPVGASVRVTNLAEHPRSRRLAELGLRPGATVDVLRRTSGGGRLLGLGTARLAVDRATASSVVVEAQ